MLIRKLFRFENAHVVRGCSTRRCSHSIHGHSYRVELLLEAHALDHGQMIYDFGLLKGDVRDLIDAFDHAVTLGRTTTLAMSRACAGIPSAGCCCPCRRAPSSSRVCSFASSMRRCPAPA